eukprot:1052605-Rhodomonas_salina.1
MARDRRGRVASLGADSEENSHMLLRGAQLTEQARRDQEDGGKRRMTALVECEAEARIAGRRCQHAVSRGSQCEQSR